MMYRAYVAWKKPIPDRMITIADGHEEIARAAMRKGDDVTTALSRLGLRAVGDWFEDLDGGSVHVEPRWDEVPVAGRPDLGVAVDPFQRRISLSVDGATTSLTVGNAEQTMAALSAAITGLNQLGEGDSDLWIEYEVASDPDDLSSRIRTSLARANKKVADLAEHLHEPTSEVRKRLIGALPFTDEEITTTAAFLDIDVAQLAPAGLPDRHRRVPAFPLPIRAYSLETVDAGETQQYGRCAWFCASEVAAVGTSVGDHGLPWCESLPLAIMRCRTIDGDDVDLYAALARGYRHGVYRTEQLRGGHTTFIHFLLSGADGHLAEWVADPSQARKFAAGLTHTTDVCDQLAVNPRLGRQSAHD